MKKQITFLLLSFLMVGVLSAQQTLLGYFSFPTQTQMPNTPTSFLADGGAQSGTASLYLDGTHGASSWTQNAELNMFTGTSTNIITGGAATYDLALVNPSANGKALVIHFSSTGYQNIVLSYATRSSNITNSFNTHSWSYSTNGVDFTPITGNTANFNTSYATKSMDFTSATAINDQADVYLKLTISGAATDAGTSVNNRVDNIQISGVPAGQDIYPPKITNSEILSANAIVLTFNEALDQTIAQTTSNYVFDNGITVSNAALASNEVTLTLSPALTEGLTYSLTVKNMQDLIGNTMNDSTLTFTFGVSSENFVANIGELKTKITLDTDANTVGTTEYKLTGEVVITAIGSQRGQKWIQDETGAVLIDDATGKITTILERGDKIKDIYGTVTNYYGLLQFVPTKNTGEPIANFQTVIPLVVTPDNIKDTEYMVDHQSELMRLQNAIFTDANGTLKFENGKKYRLNAGTTDDSLVYASIYNVIKDIIVPSGAQDVTGVNTFSRGKYYIIPRGGFDIVASGSGITENELKNVFVYPNPADDYFVIQNEMPVNIEIYNSLGVLLLQSQYASGSNIVDRNNMAVGFYTIKLTDQQTGAIATFKLILR